MIRYIKLQELPFSWSDFDIEYFSKEKKLWDYQKEAIENAIKVLWKYYEDFVDYQEGEDLKINQRRKRKLFEWYKYNGLDKDLNIKLNNKKNKKLLEDYFPVEDGKISYEHFINRMSFWMATGSGKSLVIIKLIEILKELIKRKEIPPYDILFLTHRDDLIEQFKRHLEEFNKARNTGIILKELKEYPEVKRYKELFDTIVFYYRSDNLSDEQSEKKEKEELKKIDFKNYYNEGRWYIILDEAHKGDKEDSKRQHIYSILSKNGFLFNFSATFTDPRDIITCAYEFNLSSFIEKGYGKHICILKQEIKAFRDKEDYTGEEKQKIVLKSLILLTYIRKFYEVIKGFNPKLYHKPLLLTLVNSVNTEDADLKLFFRELEKIGKGKIENNIFKQAKEELLKEAQEGLEFEFEKAKLTIDEEVLKGISEKDILTYVYNASSPGEIEVIKNRSNEEELAFKLKTSDKPFALIKIGNISDWIKELILIGYEVQERLEDESFFENLNREDSEINILMGSRSFYEGWDSNRPNVINFINIGIGKEAKKFILQSIGRGVRIEPIKNKRKRLLELYNAGEIEEDLLKQIEDKITPIETLFIFATSRNVLSTVIQGLIEEKEKTGEKTLSLLKVNPKAKDFVLLIPVYKTIESSDFENRQKFRLTKEDFDLLESFVRYIEDDRILLIKYQTEPVKVKLLREKRNIVQAESSKNTIKALKNVDFILQRYFDYLSLKEEELDSFKLLENEIEHFKNIKVYLEDIRDIEDLEEKIKTAILYEDPVEAEKKLEEKFDRGEISKEEYKESLKQIYQNYNLKQKYIEYNAKSSKLRLKIKYITEHYYIPIILSEDEKIDYIKHVINVKSEVDFIKDLEEYLSKENNKFKEFDWWMFSKIDESVDRIYIPYYNPDTNKISKFMPDFIFWLKKGDDYFILFVDPKGTKHTDAEKKIDGFERVFQENGKSKVFNYNSLKVRVKLLYRTDEKAKATEKYKKYWFESIDEMLSKIYAEGE